MKHFFSQLSYLVRWQGYSPSQDQWKPLDELDKCQELIAEFHKERADDLLANQLTLCNEMKNITDAFRNLDKKTMDEINGIKALHSAAAVKTENVDPEDVAGPSRGIAVVKTENTKPTLSMIFANIAKKC